MSFQPSRPFTLDRTVRLLLGIAAAAVAVWLADRLSGVLLPFFAGCLIAYIIEPLVGWNMRLTRMRRRLMPVLLTLVEVSAVVAGLLWAFLPGMIDECHRIGGMIKAYAATDPATVSFLPHGLHGFLQTNVDFGSLSRLLHDQELNKALGSIVRFFSGGLDAIGGLISWAIVVLYVFFILLNYPAVMRGIRSIVPPAYRHISGPVLSDLGYTMKRYFRTQAMICAIVGVIYAVGFSIVGLPMAVGIGVMNAMLFMVPYLVYVSLIPVTLLCIVCSLATGVGFWGLWLKCLCVYAVAECTSDIWLTPKLMGHSLDLQPAVILLALCVWGSLLGVLGMIIALPMTTIVISYYRQYVLGDRTAVIVERPDAEKPSENA